jgi:hypothetical protein
MARSFVFCLNLTFLVNCVLLHRYAVGCCIIMLLPSLFIQSYGVSE